jgi:hypothetical protein
MIMIESIHFCINVIRTCCTTLSLIGRVVLRFVRQNDITYYVLKRVYNQTLRCKMSLLERRNISISTVLGFKLERLSEIVLPDAENVHSDIELDAGMHKIDRAARATIGN